MLMIHDTCTVGLVNRTVDQDARTVDQDTRTVDHDTCTVASFARTVDPTTSTLASSAASSLAYVPGRRTDPPSGGQSWI